MNRNRRQSFQVAAAIVLVAVGVALAATGVSSVSSGGWHLTTLYAPTTSANFDTGVALYRFTAAGNDTVASGVYFRQGVMMFGGQDSVTLTSSNATRDSSLARGSGTPAYLTGSFTSAGNATLTARLSDTAQLTISTTSSDSVNYSEVLWASGLNGTSRGTATDTFLETHASVQASADLSIRGINFDDSAALVLSFNIGTGDSGVSTTTGGFDTRLVVRSAAGSNLSPRDSCRVIVFGPDNALVADTLCSTYDTAFRTQNIKFDTGTSNIFVLLGDTDNRLRIRRARAYVGRGVAPVAVTAAGVTAVSGAFPTLVGVPSPGAIYGCTTTISAATSPAITQFTVTDIGGDNAVFADNFASVDSATPFFDTRLPGSVFMITALDANGAEIHSLTEGTVTFEIRYSFANLTSAQASAVRAARRNEIGRWEPVTTTTVDSAGQRATITTSRFSGLGLVIVGSGAGSGSGAGGGCVISSIVPGHSMPSLMSGMRGLRDLVMSNSIGRLFVSGYYAVAAMMIMIVSGLGLTLALSHKK